MRFSEWEPVYLDIIADMGYDRSDDEACVRVLKAVTLNSDLVTEDDAAEFFGETATVFGNAPCLESDVRSLPPEGTCIVSGSAVGRVMAMGIRPDVVVTDLEWASVPTWSSRISTVTSAHSWRPVPEGR